MSSTCTLTAYEVVRDWLKFEKHCRRLFLLPSTPRMHKKAIYGFLTSYYMKECSALRSGRFYFRETVNRLVLLRWSEGMNVEPGLQQVLCSSPEYGVVMGRYWQGKTKGLRDISLCHTVHHKSHTDWLGEQAISVCLLKVQTWQQGVLLPFIQRLFSRRPCGYAYRHLTYPYYAEQLTEKTLNLGNTT
jgi:hypothetical protein